MDKIDFRPHPVAIDFRPHQPAPAAADPYAAYVGGDPADPHPDEGGPSALEALGRGAAQGVTMGFEPALVGGAKALYHQLVDTNPGGFGDSYRHGRDAEIAANRAAQDAHGGYYLGGEIGGGVLPMFIPGVGAAKGIGGAIKTGAALSAVSALGNSDADLTKGEFAQAAKDTLEGAALGGVVGAGGELLTKGVAAGARKLLPKVDAVEQRLAQALSDKAAKEAEKTAASAAGSFGATKADAFRTIERLGMKEGLTPAEIAANQSVLQTPEVQKLASEMAASNRVAAPGKMADVEAARAFADETRQGVEEARLKGLTPQYAFDSALGRAKDQIKRYTVPAVVGAATGYVLGGDDNKGLGIIGGASLGAAGNRTAQAVKNLVLGPEARRLAAHGARSITEKLANMATTNPSALGRFAPVLQRALAKGPDAFAAHTFVLGQTDPHFQAMFNELSKDTE